MFLIFSFRSQHVVLSLFAHSLALLFPAVVADSCALFSLSFFLSLSSLAVVCLPLSYLLISLSPYILPPSSSIPGQPSVYTLLPLLGLVWLSVRGIAPVGQSRTITASPVSQCGPLSFHPSTQSSSTRCSLLRTFAARGPPILDGTLVVEIPTECSALSVIYSTPLSASYTNFAPLRLLVSLTLIPLPSLSTLSSLLLTSASLRLTP